MNTRINKGYLTLSLSLVLAASFAPLGNTWALTAPTDNGDNYSHCAGTHCDANQYFISKFVESGSGSAQNFKNGAIDAAMSIDVVPQVPTVVHTQDTAVTIPIQ